MIRFKRIYRIFIYSFTFIIMLGFIVGIIISIISPNTDDLLAEQKSKTYGRISQLDSQDSYLYYYVDNERYISKIMTINSFVLGDIFEIFYYPPNPSRSKVNLEKPVFLKSEKIKKCTAQIINKTNILRPKITFQYKIQGRKYERIQYVNSKIYHNLEIDTIVDTFYWLENPQRAVIYFE